MYGTQLFIWPFLGLILASVHIVARRQGASRATTLVAAMFAGAVGGALGYHVGALSTSVGGQFLGMVGACTAAVAAIAGLDHTRQRPVQTG